MEGEKGFMIYVDKIKSKLNSIRDPETKDRTTQLVSKLEILKSTRAVTLNRLAQLETDMKKELSEDLFEGLNMSFKGFGYNQETYFNLVGDVIALKEPETNSLSEYIIDLFEIINKLVSDLEEKIQESEPEDLSKAKTEEETKPETKKENSLFDDTLEESTDNTESIEEEEEVSVSVSKFMYQCLGCKNYFKEVFMIGCKRCGKTIFQVRYIS